MLAVNNTPNQTAFTSRLNLKGVKTNLDKWQKADKILQEKTQKIPYDIYVEDFSNNGVSIYGISSNGSTEHSLGLSEKCVQALLAMTPEKMANKLAKLVRLFAKEDAENNKIIKFLQHLEKSPSAPEDLFIENYAKFAEINALDTRAALNKDRILRDSEYLI